MTLPTRQTSDENKKGLLWECLNADAVTTPGTSEDLCCLNDVVGLDYWQLNNSSIGCASRTATSQTLTQETIGPWIRQPTSTQDQQGNELCSKILIGDQILENDLLLPPPSSRQGVRFSRSLLSESFKFPPVAIVRLSRRFCWHMEFCRPRHDSSILCEGLGTVTFSFVMSFDEVTKVTKAVIVLHIPIEQCAKDARKQLMVELEKLSFLTSEPAFVPYLMLNLFMRIGKARTWRYTQERLKTDKKLEFLSQHPERLLSLKEDISISQGIHERAMFVGGIRRDATNSVKMARKWLNQVMKKPRNIADDQWPALKTQKTELRDYLDFCLQDVQNMADVAKRSEEHTARQMSQAQNMLAYEQQKLSRQDTQIGLIVAEATKKDGYAMKSLAVVAMVFLPATSVASILSMPLFNWEAEARVVNERLWVYFAVTVPLTALTIMTWWLWHRRVFPPDREKAP